MLKQLFIFSILTFYAVCQQDCLQVIESLETPLESLTHIETWDSESLRSSSLNAAATAVEQIEQVCQVCVGDVKSFVQQIKQLVSDAESHDWTTLIDESLSALENAKEFYDTCLVSNQISFVEESCINVVASVKGVLGELTSLKTWENSQLRGNLLSSLLSFISEVEGSCKTCATQAFSLKNGVQQVIADAQQKQWLELVGEIVQVLLQADQVYNCDKGSSLSMIDELDFFINKKKLKMEQANQKSKPKEGTYIPGNPKYAHMPAGFKPTPVPDNMKHGQYAYLNEPEPAHPKSSGLTSVSELKHYHLNKNQVKGAQYLINKYGFIPENDLLEHLRQHRMIEHRNKQHLDDALHTVGEVAKEIGEHVAEDAITG